MRFRQISIACASALLLLPCASCSVEELDTNGDGFISGTELLSAASGIPCDDQDEPKTPDDETPGDETPAGETPTDETPADETPAGESPS